MIWYWSVIAAGGICAILNPISNEAKTAAAQLENIKNLFGQSSVITNHRLAPLLASRGLNVKSIQQIDKWKAGEVSTDPALDASYEDICTILFTSGSTGHSKAVKFSHDQLIDSVRAKASHLSTRDNTFMSWICRLANLGNFCIC